MLLALNPLVWSAPLIVIGLVTSWMGLLFSIAVIGGWRKLAQSYGPANTSAMPAEMLPVQRFHFCSGSFGGLNYSACMTFGVDRDSLHIALQPPFRPGHPPLSIPWSEISATEKKVFLASGTELSFERVPSVRLLIPNRLALKLVRAARNCEAVTSFGADPQ